MNVSAPLLAKGILEGIYSTTTILLLLKLCRIQ
ncbi:hypothetical protein T4A_13367 [Trichinella pseudospiralis]|uniref:Uncharacterized protein n=1 Tax=Trichinella pseudospiralis TaxID=6337 RepID=A0A0V1DKN6_TRIPS|nr:hypothetical protein T4A_13367 [Trichinella pseudospiralis]